MISHNGAQLAPKGRRRAVECSMFFTLGLNLGPTFFLVPHQNLVENGASGAKWGHRPPYKQIWDEIKLGSNSNQLSRAGAGGMASHGPTIFGPTLKIAEDGATIQQLWPQLASLDPTNTIMYYHTNLWYNIQQLKAFSKKFIN